MSEVILEDINWYRATTKYKIKCELYAYLFDCMWTFNVNSITMTVLSSLEWWYCRLFNASIYDKAVMQKTFSVSVKT